MEVITVLLINSFIAPEIATKLYPHQKKALTFMLEREGERPITGGSSLWQERFNPVSQERSWMHVVTQREVFEPPRAAKGAILADDVRDRYILIIAYKAITNVRFNAV